LTHDLLARKGQAVSASPSADVNALLRGAKVTEIGDAPTSEATGTREPNTASKQTSAGLSKRWIFGSVIFLVIGSVAVGYYARPEAQREKATDIKATAQVIPSASALQENAATPVQAGAPSKPESTAAPPTNVTSVDSLKTDITVASGPKRDVSANVKLDTVLAEKPVSSTSVSAQSSAVTSKTSKQSVQSSRPTKSSEEIKPLDPPNTPKVVAKSELSTLKATFPVPPPPIPTRPPLATPQAISPSTVVASPTISKPVQQARREPASNVKPVPPATTKANYVVQLVSVKSRRAANQEWGRLQKRFATLLGSLESSVQKALVPKRGTFYRLRAGAFETRSQARALCRKVKAAGQGCLAVRR
jgi:hypothetical protein